MHAIGRVLGKGRSRRSLSIEVSWRDCSTCSSPFAASTHLGRTGRYLPRSRLQLLDAGHSPTSESRLLHDEPGVAAGTCSIQPSKPIVRPGCRPCDPGRLSASPTKLQQIVESKLLQECGSAARGTPASTDTLKVRSSIRFHPQTTCRNRKSCHSRPLGR